MRPVEMLLRSMGCLALTATLTSCRASASWKDVQVAANYQRPREVTLKVLASNEGGDVAGLELALVDAFGERDIHATPLDEENANPNLRVVIEKWRPGSRETRGGLNVVGAAAGLPGVGGLAAGEIIVDVRAMRESGEPFIQGKAKSFVDKDADASLHAIAELIARAVATGEAWPDPAENKPHSSYP